MGADVHAADDAALRWTSLNGNLDMVEFLLKNGADVHAEDDFALRYTSRYGHLDVIELLLRMVLMFMLKMI